MWQRLTCGLMAVAAPALVAACGSSTGSGAGSTPAVLHLASVAMPDGSTAAQAQVGNTHRAGRVGCHGESRSPDLEWSGAPAGVRSYAVTMFDPDAPRVGGVWHWVVFDIAPTTTSLPAALPANTPLARQARNTANAPSYMGPCPPPGSPHRYVVTLYALNVASLSLPDGTDNAPVRAAIQAHTLTSATLTAHYSQ